MRIWLESRAGETVPVRGHCSIGRARTNRIAISCDQVSRRHALIHLDEEGQCLLIDLGSSNGTFVNGRRVNHLANLNAGDAIEIGSHRFILRASLAPQENGGALSAHDASASGAELATCWMLIGDSDKSGASDDEFAADDSFKTMVSWAQVCQRLIVQHQGAISNDLTTKLFGFWADPNRDASVASSVAGALKQLQVIQTRHPNEFRLVLHYGMVVVGSSHSNRQKALIGTEVTFAFQMRGIASVLSTKCLISAEANFRIAPLLATRPLEPSGSGSFDSKHQFFTL